MSSALFLWVPFTFCASLAQVVRNGAQASLTRTIGTLGATQVRFVFGLPFAALFLLAALAIAGEPLPVPGTRAIMWTALGGLTQIGGTALMLLVMGRRRFSVAYAYIKTEPVVVALLGVAILGDRLPAPGWLAVCAVTLGVVVASVRPADFRLLVHERGMIAAGIGAGGLLGMSSILFRGAIGQLPEGGFVVRSLTVLVLSLFVQSVVLGTWLALRDRKAFTGSLREWRHSLGAGFLGALSSACWFAAFSLTAAANVRTLALVEMPLAALLSGRIAGHGVARHELIGMALVMGGVALLIWSVAA